MHELPDKDQAGSKMCEWNINVITFKSEPKEENVLLQREYLFQPT